MNQNRVPQGIPTGGQFAATARAESNLALAEPPGCDDSTVSDTPDQQDQFDEATVDQIAAQAAELGDGETYRVSEEVTVSVTRRPVRDVDTGRIVSGCSTGEYAVHNAATGAVVYFGYDNLSQVAQDETLAVDHMAAYAHQVARAGAGERPEPASVPDEEDAEEFRLNHQAPSNDGYNRPAHDLDDMMPDVYERPDLYDNGEPGIAEAKRVVRTLKGRPDAEVTVYRSLPVEYIGDGSLRQGDWVSLAREYAANHGVGMREDGGDWPVIAVKVKASQIYNEGYLSEFGYDPSTEPHD